MAVRCLSYNCNGLKSFMPNMNDVLNKCDLLCLQELMITKQDCNILNNCHNDWNGFAVSHVDASLGVIRGRPNGGVGFLWQKILDNNIVILNSPYDWLCCVKIIVDSNECYVIDVYLPYEKPDHCDSFKDCLAKIVVFMQGISSTCIMVVGDFNADLAKYSIFGEILTNYCVDNNLIIADLQGLTGRAYIYVSSALGSTSWLDHVICTHDAVRCISEFVIEYTCIQSDHHPIGCKIDLNIVPASNHEDSAILRPRIKWDKLHPHDITEYEMSTNDELGSIVIGDGITCHTPNCNHLHHAQDIDALYNDIMHVLTEKSNASATNGRNHVHNRPGWNEYVMERHTAARDAYILWKTAGTLRVGIIYDLMKQTKAQFKCALRQCKRQTRTIFADRLADSMNRKNDKDFWRDIHNSTYLSSFLMLLILSRVMGIVHLC